MHIIPSPRRARLEDPRSERGVRLRHLNCWNQESVSYGYPNRSRSRGVVPSFLARQQYQGTSLQVTWSGRVISDTDAFLAYLSGRVRNRVFDSGMVEPLEEVIRGMRTTGMETDGLEAFLASTPSPAPWEIGEALAECLLSDGEDWLAYWPWNSRRDRRTPLASLPGADLVGFKAGGTSPQLLFGEVKTSSDLTVPPGVMNGRDNGLAYQIESLSIQWSPTHFELIKWLWSRCQQAPDQLVFRPAVEKYIQSNGKDLAVVGVLLRDTPPNEDDLKRRSVSLSARISAPTAVQFIAWYAPHPISSWPDLVNGGGQ